MITSKFNPLDPSWNDPSVLRTDSLPQASGAFVSLPPPGATIPVPTENVTTFNAALPPHVGSTVRELRLGAEFTVEDAIAGARELVPGVAVSDVKVFEYFDLLILGDAIAAAAVRIGFGRPDLALFPLRGGYKLYRFLDSMVPEHPPFRCVPFSEAATNPTAAKDAFFLEHIRDQIRAFNPESELFRLHIVDVGESGAGSRKMLELVRRAREMDAPRQRWCVVFHVFHPPGREWNFRRLQLFTGDFQAIFECYPTSTLLLDDWDSAVGLRKEQREMLGAMRGSKLILPMPVPFSQPLALVVKKDSHHHLFGSTLGEKVADKILSNFTTDAMFSPSYVRDPSRDVWDDWAKRRKAIKR